MKHLSLKWQHIGVCCVASGLATSAHASIHADIGPEVLLYVVIALVAIGVAMAFAKKLMSAIYRQITAAPPKPASKAFEVTQPLDLTTAPPTVGAPPPALFTASSVWGVWALALAGACMSTWKGLPDRYAPVSLDMFFAVLALLALLLLSSLLSKFLPIAPQMPARWRQGLIWLIPVAMSLALAYDHSTRHHYPFPVTKTNISLADLRALNSSELAALPLGGDLQPGSCQVRLNKVGDGWGNPLMSSTASNELSDKPGESVYVLGLQTDGPAVVSQNVPGYQPDTSSPRDNFQEILSQRMNGTWYDGGIAQSGFQWTLFGRNFQTQSSKLMAQRSKAFDQENGRLKALLRNEEQQEHARPTVPGDPALKLSIPYNYPPDAQMNQLIQQRNWDCSQQANSYQRYCEDKQTGQRFKTHKYLVDFCSGFNLDGITTQGKLINLSAPDSTVRMIESKSWYLWVSELGANQEFNGQSLIFSANSLDPAGRENDGQGVLVCPDPTKPSAEQKYKQPTIEATLPYSPRWLAQLPEKDLELAKFRAVEDQMLQETAAAPAKIKALEDAYNQFKAAQPLGTSVSLWVRTTRSQHCQASGHEVCKRFEAVLGPKFEPVVLEERCSDQATAKRVSNFSTPMFKW